MQNLSPYSQMFVPAIRRSGFRGRLFCIHWNKTGPWRPNFGRNEERRKFLRVLTFLDVNNHFQFYCCCLAITVHEFQPSATHIIEATCILICVMFPNFSSILSDDEINVRVLSRSISTFLARERSCLCLPTCFSIPLLQYLIFGHNTTHLGYKNVLKNVRKTSHVRIFTEFLINWIYYGKA